MILHLSLASPLDLLLHLMLRHHARFFEFKDFVGCALGLKKADMTDVDITFP